MTDRQIDRQMIDWYTLEYYLALKKDTVICGNMIDLEILMFSETSKT
jgi:hypothetical protein